jgi:protein XRP2
MGNFCAKEGEDTPKKEPKSSGKKAYKGGRVKMSYERPIPALSQGRARAEASRDPKDYEATNLEDQVWVRMPGQINDQRITIENCKNCKFYLLDQADSVQVDDCTNCVFFIGPTMGSVFIRSCENITVAVACSQLRLRDVKHSAFTLFCAGRPVLENSHDIGIQCYHVHQYFQLREHFAAAKLSIFNNMYSMVHDFTPKANNFHYLPRGDTPLVERLSALSPEHMLPDEEDATAADVVVPYTHGVQAHPHATTVLVVFLPGCVEEATLFVEAVGKAGALILHTREHNFSPEDVAAAFDHCGASLDADQKAAFQRGPCICVAVAAAASAPYIPTESSEALLYKTSGDVAHKASCVIFEKLPLAAGFGSSL